MSKRPVLVVTLAVCLGFLGLLVAKDKTEAVQATIDRADVVAGLDTPRDQETSLVVKAEMLVGMSRTLIAEGAIDQATSILERVSQAELPDTLAAEKVIADAYLALGEIYSLQPVEGLHKALQYYGLALERLEISGEPGLMERSLLSVADVYRTLGDLDRAAAMELAASNVRAGIDPGPLGLVQASAQRGAEDLGDDTCDQAVDVTLPHSEIMSISFPGDHNWRSFTLSEAAVVRLETLSSDTFGDDTDLTLWDGCPGNLVEFDDDGGPGFLSLIELCLAPGDYWAEVGGFADISTPDDFEFVITEVEPCVIPEPDQYEPDDESSVATPIGFRNNGSGHGNQIGRDNKQIQDHSIFPAGDIDFVSFELSRSNLVRIETFGDESPDTIIGMSNASGQLLAVDDDGGAGLSSKLEFCLPDGAEWLVAIIGFSASDEFEYSVAVDVEFPCLFETEPNATCDLATDVLVPGDIWSGLQTAAGVAENDWYVLELEEAAFVEIATDGWDEFSVDTFLELWDGCPGTLIAADDDAGPGFLSLIGTSLEAGTYYVNATVSPFSVGANYPYSISVTLSEPPLTETEPNDSCATANAANLGETFLASINPAGDRDHFLLSVPTDSFVEIETDGPSGDTVLQIESADGSTVIGCDDDTGNGLFSLWGCCLPAGDYCVVVRDFGDNSVISSYDIGFRGLGDCTPSDPPVCSVSGLGCPF